MSVIQSKQQELRFLKREQLKQESTVVRNYFHDIIRSFGIDCEYCALQTPYPEIFDTTVNQNNLLLHAYGFDHDPKYPFHASIIGYMQVENDIFQLSKYGIIPNTDVTFYFEEGDFATALASQLGRLHEYTVNPVEYKLEGLTPEELDDLHIVLPFTSPVVSGEVEVTGLDKVSVDIGVPVEVEAVPTMLSKPRLDFPVNEFIYKSFNYTLSGDEADAVKFGFKFVITPSGVRTGKTGTDTYDLSGVLNGSILFRDLNLAGKYKDKIRPKVGDVIAIDFPGEVDSQTGTRYEITEVTDKALDNAGLNPLLNVYIWRCKARRYVEEDGDQIPIGDENTRKMSEIMDFNNTMDSVFGGKVSVYDNNEDSVYGGYEKKTPWKDPNAATPEVRERLKEHKDGFYIMKFGDGSSLWTNGTDQLVFRWSNGTMEKNLLDGSLSVNTEPDYTNYPGMTNSANDDEFVANGIKFEDISSCHGKDTCGASDEDFMNEAYGITPPKKISKKGKSEKDKVQFIKATDEGVYFTNLNNRSWKLVGTGSVDLGTDSVNNERIQTLNILNEATLYARGTLDCNFDGNNFYKFNNTLTVLVPVPNGLLVKYGNGTIDRLV